MWLFEELAELKKQRNSRDIRKMALSGKDGAIFRIMRLPSGQQR